jgi:hypothetical protein
MTFSEILMVLAVLLAPVVAIQVSVYLERRRERLGRRRDIFRTLMATRASRLAPTHVEALNMIDLEFYGKDQQLRAVREAWKAYYGEHQISFAHESKNVASRLSFRRIPMKAEVRSK